MSLDYKDDKIHTLFGDCLERLRDLPDNSVDSIVTDPPYGMSKQPDMAEVLSKWLAGEDYVHTGGGFMGKKWDSFVPGPSIWRECLRVLKPGGQLLAFSSTRTYDLMTLAIRLAGFEIRDQINWVYGSGFPKSLDVSKAIDKMAGAKREVLSEKPAYGLGGKGCLSGHSEGATAKQLGDPVTAAATEWDGWGTALKPALEPVTVARKPLEGTVAANVLKHGTGAINIDGCRVPSPEGKTSGGRGSNTGVTGWQPSQGYDENKGRWPTNLIHDGSPEVVELFPSKAGAVAPVKGTEPSCAATGEVYNMRQRVEGVFHGDAGSAARFFYCAKASKADREYGLPDTAQQHDASECTDRAAGSDGLNSPRAGAGRTSGSKNKHPTVKPRKLMTYLQTLVTPPGGVTLDPFMGSGTSGTTAVEAGFRFIGIERDPDYYMLAWTRITGSY